MPLSLSGQLVLAPKDAEAVPAETLFKELCAEFKIHDSIAHHLVTECGLSSLHDFQHAFTSDADLAQLVHDMPVPPPQVAPSVVQNSTLSLVWVVARRSSVRFPD